MDFVGDLLEPHQQRLGELAILVTRIQFLSGAFLLYDIYKKKTTKGFTLIPFIGGLVLSVMLSLFGAAIDDEVTIKANVLGIAMNIFYICIYNLYTPKQLKSRVWYQIILGGMFTVACIVYIDYSGPELFILRLGILLTVISLALAASPFLGLPKILGTPFPIILLGFIFSCSWLAYGFSIRNSMIVTQNVILGIVRLAQLTEYSRKSKYVRQQHLKRN